jgi:hypothetical protein
MTRAWPRTDERSWHVQRGIPVIPMLVFIVTITAQGFIAVRYVVALEQKLSEMERGQARIETRVDRLDTKVDLLSGRFDNAQVPAAVNTRRIEDIERRLSDLERVMRR